MKMPNRKWFLLAAEVGLVMVILALLVLTWLPAIIGARPGSSR